MNRKFSTKLFTSEYISWLHHLLLLNENIKLNQCVNLLNFDFSQMFYLKMLKLSSISICHKYFYLSKIICARHVETVCNKKPKSWSQILGHGSMFLVLSLRSRSWFLDPESWVLGSGFQIPGLKSSMPVHLLIITKCNEALLLGVKGIKKCGSY